MIALLLYSLIHVLEAWLEVIVIELKNDSLTNYIKLNHKEHFRSAVLSVAWFMFFAMVICGLEAWWLIGAALPNRRLFFDFPLAIFRQRPMDKYEGDDWWVRRFVFVFGKNGRIRELIVEILIMVSCIYFHLSYTAGIDKQVWNYFFS